MARTRGCLARRPDNFDNRRLAAAKEIANARRRNHRFKIKLLLPQGKTVDVKVRGNVVRQMRVEDIYMSLILSISNQSRKY